jgi:hypothetical protein
VKGKGKPQIEIFANELNWAKAMRVSQIHAGIGWDFGGG